MEPCIYYAPILNPKLPDAADWFPDGALAVDADGRIEFVGGRADLPEHLSHLPCTSTDRLMVPGFVDTHIHLPQYDCRGKFGVSLMDWLQSFIFKEEARFADAEVARDMAARFFSGLVSAGTTTAMVFSSVHEASTSIAFEEADRSRLRIIMGKIQMDRNVPDALCETLEASTAATERLMERWNRSTDRLWYAVTPRFAPSCTMELMRESAKIAARNDVYIQTHINESPDEVKMVHELFPGCRHYTDVYDQAGLLGPKTVLAHNIHVGNDELDRCEELSCAVAHCPDSNLFLGSGRFPIELYRGRSIRVGLGSDVGAGTTVSMLQVMRSMTHVQGASMHPFIPLYHATLGGAQALSLDRSIGNFEAGKQADFLLVDIGDRFAGGRKIDHQRALEIASVLVYRANDQDVKEVYVGGEKLYPFIDR